MQPERGEIGRNSGGVSGPRLIHYPHEELAINIIEDRFWNSRGIPLVVGVLAAYKDPEARMPPRMLGNRKGDEMVANSRRRPMAGRSG